MSDWLPTSIPAAWLVHGPGAFVQVGGANAGRYAQRPGSESAEHQCEDVFDLKIFHVGTICNVTDITNNNSETSQSKHLFS